MPYFPQANYSRNSIPNANWNDFSHESPLKQQHLLNNNEGTPEVSTNFLIDGVSVKR